MSLTVTNTTTITKLSPMYVGDTTTTNTCGEKIIFNKPTELCKWIDTPKMLVTLV